MTAENYSEDLWVAPVAAAPIDATLDLPGSKSLTNRELVLSAIADSPTRLFKPLESRDSSLMVAALKKLGLHIYGSAAGFSGVSKSVDNPNDFEQNPLEIRPSRVFEVAKNAGFEAKTAGTQAQNSQVINSFESDSAEEVIEIAVGLAGTVMRFVPPLVGLFAGNWRFVGDKAAERRPMNTTIDSLRALGLEVIDDGRGTLPFTVRSTGRVRGGELTIDASASSQFVSGLLLSAARFELGLTLRHSGEHLPSMPHIEMTLDCLAKRGVRMSQPEPSVWRVEPGPISGGDIVIEPDLSNAGPFLAAAMVAGGTVRINDWPTQTTQVGREFVWLLERLGAHVELVDGAISVTGGERIRGIDVDLSIGGELAPVIVALAVLADGPSRITGIAHLRGHETDRLAALVAEIDRIGGKARELADGIEIEPVPVSELHGATWHCYEDHRMATAGAILGLKIAGIALDDVGSTSKTLPNFVELWQGMLAGNR
jgi:3-phosphoshikimate 1-carboxyvinyltransferase